MKKCFRTLDDTQIVALVYYTSLVVAVTIGIVLIVLQMITSVPTMFLIGCVYLVLFLFSFGWLGCANLLNKRCDS